MIRGFLLLITIGLLWQVSRAADERPHVVLVMTDDQGWGQMGYMGHPHLKTPHLDAMADAGLRLDRFYAGASNCSPTRATVLTGRTNDRTGVHNHGYPLRLQEKTLAQALKGAGYQTAHFGKWHLNGLRGPGVPILGDDTHSPGGFGFDHWLSVTNFFDVDPVLSRMGEFEEYQGDSSEVAVDAALEYLKNSSELAEKPQFIVIWFGSPHSPMVCSDEDLDALVDFPDVESKDGPEHHGELVAMDRSIGALRAGLRELGIAENTILWFNSDNGGLAKMGVDTVGGLRGFKNTMYEGGLRVPAVIEWPAVIEAGRRSSYPCGTVDIFPTIAECVGLDPDEVMLQPRDGESLRTLFDQDIKTRERPLAFRHSSRGVIIDNDLKYISQDKKEELYHLIDDTAEANNLAADQPEQLARMRAIYQEWDATVEASVAGKDYPEGAVDADQPARRFWYEDAAYLPFLEGWRDRPEYKGSVLKGLKLKSSKKETEVK